MFITILASIHGCALCSRGSQTLDMDLIDQWSSCPSYKRVNQMQRHIFGILVSKMIKYKYDTITKFLVISPRTNPMKEW